MVTVAAAAIFTLISANALSLVGSSALAGSAEAARATCQVSALKTISKALGPGLGRGPVYPIISPTFIVEHPVTTGPFAGSGWGGSKTLWVAPRSYRGPITIQGRQLDGPHEVRFGKTSEQLDTELFFPAGSTMARSKGAENWRQFPVYTRLQAAGCYAFTVRGTGFVRRIFFRVRVVRPTR